MIKADRRGQSVFPPAMDYPRFQKLRAIFQMCTGCCPNHPRKDVASFLRLAQAARGIFFEVRSNLILLTGGNRYQSC